VIIGIIVPAVISHEGHSHGGQGSDETCDVATDPANYKCLATCVGTDFCHEHQDKGKVCPTGTKCCHKHERMCKKTTQDGDDVCNVGSDPNYKCLKKCNKTFCHQHQDKNGVCKKDNNKVCCHKHEGMC